MLDPTRIYRLKCNSATAILPRIDLKQIGMAMVRALYAKIIAALAYYARRTSTFDIKPEGFHGDQHLIMIMDALLSDATYFIETGANVGSTLVHVAKRFPELPCYSCEPDRRAYEIARTHTCDLANVHLTNEGSIDMLERLCSSNIFDTGRFVFWLDAHGYGFEWPLREEIRLITRNCRNTAIVIDDFRVPGKTEFGFDSYQGQICEWQFIKDCIEETTQFRLFYPAYTDHTSSFHPLRGWGWIEIDTMGLPPKIATVISERPDLAEEATETSSPVNAR